VTFYRRKLPHWHPEAASIFLTWRLYGSLPASVRTARNGCPTKYSAGKQFKLFDSALDKGATGPLWLKDPRIAASIVEVIRKGESVLGYFALHAFVVMPNHVHLLITPKISVPRITNGIKGTSSHQANAILSREGQHFWQDESFDHWVRSPKEFDKIRAYIENNPVSAGLVPRGQDWLWSTAAVSAPAIFANGNTKARK
jgi:REP element-mobilizing transposase RayT